MPDPAPTDPFLDLSIAAWMGLWDAIRECDWIADGGDASASQAERDLAALKQLEYDNEATKIMKRNMAYLAKLLSIAPPTAADVETAKALATSLAQMKNVNVKVSAVVGAATELLNIYRKTEA